MFDILGNDQTETSSPEMEDTSSGEVGDSVLKLLLFVQMWL